MVDDKVGIKEYLGIKINYSNEKLLDKFSLDTLKDMDIIKEISGRQRDRLYSYARYLKLLESE